MDGIGSARRPGSAEEQRQHHEPEPLASAPPPPPPPPPQQQQLQHQARDEDLSAKAACKRYEGLLSVRSKAVKGKGAWYWSHLEPVLVQGDTGIAKAVKLRCGLCSSMFSASNPSRTAAEHLKRGTCPNFALASRAPAAATAAAAATAVVPKQITAAAPASHSPRKRHATAAAAERVLSGGKEDLGALAALEDSVKKLKGAAGSGTPSTGRTTGDAAGAGGSGSGPAAAMSKEQSEKAINLLAEWLYETCGSVPLSCVEHPKFRAFLNQVGLRPVSARHIAGSRLDSKYQEVRQQSQCKLREAMFFQLSADGWKRRRAVSLAGAGSLGTGAAAVLVVMTINLPNGRVLFHKVAAVDPGPMFPSKAAEETLAEAVAEACRGLDQPPRCVGIVADADKRTRRALQELESKQPWMVNLGCQARSLRSLLKDLNKRLPLFSSVGRECLKIANFFKLKALHQQYQFQEMEALRSIRVPPDAAFSSTVPFHQVLALFEDVSRTARALQLVVADEAFKVMFGEESREVAALVMTKRFWADLEAALQLVCMVKAKVVQVERERPLVSGCIPLWVELRGAARDWCNRFGVDVATVDEILCRRMAKVYHPAWAAALVLDPLYLVQDAGSGRYLPPYSSLSQEQERDVDRLVVRLVSRDEASLVLTELMKWRSEGLEPLYAQAVKAPDPASGGTRALSAQARRLVWETWLSQFKVLARVAARLIFLHATSCGLRYNWPLLRWALASGGDKAEKMVYIASHAKLEGNNSGGSKEEEEGSPPPLFNNGGDFYFDEEEEQQHEQYDGGYSAAAAAGAFGSWSSSLAG